MKAEGKKTSDQSFSQSRNQLMKMKNTAVDDQRSPTPSEILMLEQGYGDGDRDDMEIYRVLVSIPDLLAYPSCFPRLRANVNKVGPA